MVPSKIRKGVQCCVADPEGKRNCEACPYEAIQGEGGHCQNRMHNDVDKLIEQLLKRHEGMEPKLEEKTSITHVAYADGHHATEARHFLDWTCPSCGYFVGELYCGFGRWHIQQEHSYCARCGQKIDWTKPKDEEKRRYEERLQKEREAFYQENGIPLDNMNERRRMKYGLLEDDEPF